MAMTLLANANNMEYEQVMSLVWLEKDRRTHRKVNVKTKDPESQGSAWHPYPLAQKSSTEPTESGQRRHEEEI